MRALDYIVRSGRALYVGISNYRAEDAAKAIKLLADLGTPCLIHQPNYNMFDRWIESSLLKVLDHNGVGCIVFSPLAQGLLTNKYLKGIPEDSRAGKSSSIFLNPKDITDPVIAKVRKLNGIAQEYGLSMAQMAINWTLRKPAVTSALIGASRPAQIEEIVKGTQKSGFSEESLQEIEAILAE
jgi:L-glyceraldehyde 3-phosphate reductase